MLLEIRLKKLRVFYLLNTVVFKMCRKRGIKACIYAMGSILIHGST